MDSESLRSAMKKRENIKNSHLTIYDAIEIGDPNYWLTSKELGEILTKELAGESFKGLPLRTRSKKAKALACVALGYPIPNVFKKAQPRFTGQYFDTYVQKSNNLQVWNEELDAERRYVLIRVNEEDIVTKVKVVTGSDLAVLDTTGTLTQKYQARLVRDEFISVDLISRNDTKVILDILATSVGDDKNLTNDSPIGEPDPHKLLGISDVFERLKSLVGAEFSDAGSDQERNRGACLHRLACQALGYNNYYDNGRFPDIQHQLLEVKLQTSPTIDLGLVCPDSTSLLDIEKICGFQVRHCDIRYALFCGTICNGLVKITNFYLTTGEDFFTKFTKFGGKVLNKKIQIPLPADFFLR